MHIHLSGWKRNSDSLDQSSILFRSACSASFHIIHIWDLTFVSSAYENTSNSAILSTIVLIYITNKTGLKTDPYGMPLLTSYHVDSYPFTTTRCCLWLKGPDLFDDVCIKILVLENLCEAAMWNSVESFHKISIDLVHTAAPDPGSLSNGQVSSAAVETFSGHE